MNNKINYVHISSTAKTRKQYDIFIINNLVTYKPVAVSKLMG